MRFHLGDRTVVQTLLMLLTTGPGLLLADRIVAGIGIGMLGDLGEFRLMQALLTLMFSRPGHEFGSRGIGGGRRIGHGAGNDDHCRTTACRTGPSHSGLGLRPGKGPGPSASQLFRRLSGRSTRPATAPPLPSAGPARTAQPPRRRAAVPVAADRRAAGRGRAVVADAAGGPNARHPATCGRPDPAPRPCDAAGRVAN